MFLICVIQGIKLKLNFPALWPQIMCNMLTELRFYNLRLLYLTDDEEIVSN